MTQPSRPERSILIINPNSTASMTRAVEPLVARFGFSTTSYTYFTAPSGPTSINNEIDAAASADHCLPHLLPILKDHDAFLVCCYSQHPLVQTLKERAEVVRAGKPVTGILEASVSASLLAIHPRERFGIVSTGKVWEELLGEAVRAFLGNEEAMGRFAGVQTTGLNATELHDAPPEEVRKRMKEAVKRLLRTEEEGRGGVGAICLGCAGMAGMDQMVREACVEELGEEKGGRVRIIDGVVAGVAWLEGALRSGI